MTLKDLGLLPVKSLLGQADRVPMKDFPKRRFPEGFTLIEIMIVIAIIGLLVSVGLPNFLRLRMNANEKLILSDLRVFNNANESYRAFQRSLVYAADIPALTDGGYINDTWMNPHHKNGYRFVYTANPNGAVYSMEADVLTPNVTGVNYYCVDQTGIIVSGPVAGLGTADGCVGGKPVGS